MSDVAVIPHARRTLAPTTFTEAMEFAKQLARSSMVPKEYQGHPENIVLAMQWGMEVGLGPLQALQSIAIINGKPSVYGDALLAMVRGSPVCDDVIETFEGDGDNLAAICEARRKGKEPVTVRFGVADAKRAGLWGKSGPWQQYPSRMLQMRARGFALRNAFPDVLRGVITREEAEDYPVDVSKGREPIDVTPKADLDNFAAAPTEVTNAETGEVIDLRPFIEAGDVAAAGGMRTLKIWCELPEIRGHWGALRANRSRWIDIAHRADERQDPFGIDEEQTPGEAEGRPGEGSANTRAPVEPPHQGDLISGN